jgi:DNA (cytosine-5)-methyltransferase 1
MRELALFAGAGGGILGGLLLGWRTVCAVEIDPYCRRVLLARQRDGILAPFPIWDDVRTFDGTPWRGHVDVISGGFPCQDISVAGKGAGLSGARSGLWSEFARVIREVRPRFVFVENSPMLVGAGLDRVLADLAALGFDARWGVFSACAVGAPHVRERLFLVADADRFDGAEGMGIGNGNQDDNGPSSIWGARRLERARGYHDTRMEAEPGGVGMAARVPHRVDRVRAIGNAQVPAVVVLAWKTLTRGAGE